MARPKKLSSDEMVTIVDTYFATEAAGDPAKLKCSLLEAYASRKDIPVKAYDFRRDEKVRVRIEELKHLVQAENGVTVQLGDPYKNLDIEHILKARRDPDSLRQVLGELDAYWQKIYEVTLEERKKAAELKSRLQKLEQEKETIKKQEAVVSQECRERRIKERELIAENRYLRKMLKTYLYPALANEILTQEQLLKNADTKITEQAKTGMIDGHIPASVSEGIKSDSKTLTAEENILKQMWDAVPEVDT